MMGAMKKYLLKCANLAKTVPYLHNKNQQSWMHLQQRNLAYCNNPALNRKTDDDATNEAGLNKHCPTHLLNKGIPGNNLDLPLLAKKYLVHKSYCPTKLTVITGTDLHNTELLEEIQTLLTKEVPRDYERYITKVENKKNNCFLEDIAKNKALIRGQTLPEPEGSDISVSDLNLYMIPEIMATNKVPSCPSKPCNSPCDPCKKPAPRCIPPKDPCPPPPSVYKPANRCRRCKRTKPSTPNKTRG